MKREEVLERMAPMMDLRMRQVEHTPRTRVMVRPDAVLLRPAETGKFLPMTVEGTKSMASYAGMPESLAKQLSPDTFGRVATELLASKGRYAVVMRQGMIVAFAKHARNAVNPERALRTIEQGIGSRNTDYHRVHVLDNAVTLEVVGAQQTAVARGDIVRAGAMVTFSPIGTVLPEVQSFALRLACVNGATSTDVVKEYHYGGNGDGDEFWEWFRQSVGEAYASIGRIVERYREMRREKIPAGDRALVLEAMIRQASLNKATADAVRAQAIAEPPRTAYDVSNLVTWASSHLLERPAEVRRAQDAAARFADETEHRRLCPVCHRSR